MRNREFPFITLAAISGGTAIYFQNKALTSEKADPGWPWETWANGEFDAYDIADIAATIAGLLLLARFFIRK